MSSRSREGNWVMNKTQGGHEKDLWLQVQKSPGFNFLSKGVKESFEGAKFLWPP